MTLEELAQKAEHAAAIARQRAARDCVDAMGKSLTSHVKEILSGGSPSAPGSPPGLRSGELRGSVRQGPVRGGGVYASTTVAPHTIYAGIQEFGGDVRAHPGPGRSGNPRYRHTLFFDSDGPHFPFEVHLPARPYMRPSAAWAAAGGIIPAGQRALDELIAEAWG